MIIISVFCFSCEGSEGPEGPIEPVGPSGPQGPVGAADTDGEDGVDWISGSDGADGDAYKDFVETFDNDPRSDLIFTTEDNPWVIIPYTPASGTSSYNNYAITSATITDDKQSHLYMTFDMPVEGVCSFQVEISSEVSADYLYWYLNGDVIDGISGIGGPFTFYIQLPAGENQIVWSYQKDASVAEGADGAVIDNVVVTNYEATCLSSPELPSTVSLFSPKK